MSIWFRLNASVKTRPDSDKEGLAAALAAIEELIPESIYRDGAEVVVEVSHDMSHGTAEKLAAAVKDLVRDFGAGQAVRVETKYEDDDTFTYFVGPKAAVVAALQDDAAKRSKTSAEQLARDLGKFAEQPDKTFVETEGW